MSVERIGDQSPPPTFGADRPVEAVCAGDASSEGLGGRRPRVVVTGGFSDTVETLLQSVARGDQGALVALQRRMTGLVRVNVRRILRDASRSETATRATFADVRKDAIHFDPDRDCAQTWLLTRAHQHAMDGLHSVEDTGDPQSSWADQSASVFPS